MPRYDNKTSDRIQDLSYVNFYNPGASCFVALILLSTFLLVQTQREQNLSNLTLMENL
jgi:hypothetical protein